MKIRKPFLKIALPPLVLVAGLLSARQLVAMRAEPAVLPPEVEVPLVQVTPVDARDLQLVVEATGTVVPRTESALVSEVDGRVVEVSSALKTGGFFEAGEVLVRIDPADYRTALAQAELGVAQAELRLAREEADAAVARREWSELGRGEAEPLTLREPQVAEARAALAAARALLEQAGRDLERCELRAPYDGRVRRQEVDLGQYVMRGRELARLYAVDWAEVRLPLADEDLAFLDLPLSYREETAAARGPAVVLRARFAGREHSWQGTVVRTEGELDPASRMVVAVARVEDPYGRGDDLECPPLALGMFVRAEIRGREVTGVVRLPRSAFRGESRVLVVDEAERLHIRPVEVLRRQREHVIVRAGLETGERVVVSPLEVVMDGMAVRVSGAEAGR